MYSFDGRVRYSEVDHEGRMTFPAILDYFQDCSSFHSEDLGVGIDFLKEQKVAWVLVSWQIQVKRYPGYGEPITVGTWPYDFKGFCGSRNFVLMDKGSNILACADSLWALMNPETGRPVRVLPKMKEAYKMKERFPMQEASRKILIPGDLSEKTPFEVHRYHLDTNQHVNNGKYILMAQEYLPEGFITGFLRAEYKHSALLGDTIYPWVFMGEKQAVVVLADAKQSPYAVIEFKEVS